MAVASGPVVALVAHDAVPNRLFPHNPPLNVLFFSPNTTDVPVLGRRTL